MNTATLHQTPALASHARKGSPFHRKEDQNPLTLLTKGFETHSAAVAEKLTKGAEEVEGLKARLDELEQKAARRGGGGGSGDKQSLGHLVVASDGVKGMNAHQRGKASVVVSRKAITSGSSTVGTGRSPGTSLAPADRRPEIIAPIDRRFVIRDLIAADGTDAAAIEYPVETGFVNSAAMVAEGETKPYSDLTFDLKTAPVRTLAHMFKASRQILDDSPALAGYIDTRGRYGLKLKEERQIFFGDGTGQNLVGLMGQSRAYQTARTKTGDQDFDVLLHAISQVEDAELPATGIVMATRDWRRLLGIKDNDGRYLSNGPFAETAPRIWDLPVYPTNTFVPGQFLVGAFNSGGAQIFDRMDVEVLVSTENVDDFERNMCSIRIEERLAFACYRPDSFVSGTLPGAA